MPPSVALNETELLRLSADRDPVAFDILYNQFYERLLFFARKFVPLESAEDILSNTFVKLWARTESFDSLAQLEQWLRITTRNACIDEIRKQERTNSQISEMASTTDSHYDQLYFKSTIEAELFNRILAEIEQLPGLSSSIIKLSFLEGLSVDEIATRLNLSRQVVYNKKSLGLKALRIALSDTPMALLVLKIFLYPG